MRKGLLLCAGILFSAITCSGCDVSEMSSLSDLSKPYVGVYHCEKLLLGGKDMLEQFESITLELTYGGDFTFAFVGADGNEGEYAGTYEADPAAGELRLNAKNGLRTQSFVFPLVDGTVHICYQLGRQLLYAEFKLS